MSDEQPDRTAEYRDLRRQLEEAVQSMATSIDGRRFEFQAPLPSLALTVGGYVVLQTGSGSCLGQVLTLELGHLESAEFTVTLAGTAGSVRAPVAVRAGLGTGVILDGPGTPFLDAPLAPADDPAIESWLERSLPESVSLTIGSLALAPSHPARIDGGGFDRHTFLCGQSGSGKTYSLGLVLEQLLAQTSLRVIVLDPNSDFVKLAHVRPGVDPEQAEAYRGAVEGLRVLGSGEGVDRPLRLRFSELQAATRAALLQLDPVADRDEYAALIHILDQEERGEPLVGNLGDLVGLDQEGARRLGLRAGNLGVDKLEIWEAGRGGSLVEMIADRDDWRCLVVDLGSLGDNQAVGVVSNAVLSTLWVLRARRQPVLVVIDEAHNVCPSQPPNRLTGLATDRAVQIAAEGRKFGIHLLVSTQRPQKVHENVLSQCDNLILMRVNSAADLAYLGEMFSFVPAGLLAQSGGFGLGEALVAGKISPQPALVRFGARISEEGGSDVGKGWAERA